MGHPIQRMTLSRSSRAQRFSSRSEGSRVHLHRTAILLTAILVSVFAAAQPSKIKVIADQDSAGPQGTNFVSL